MSSKPPNVLVFFTDQQRWDTTGLHGNPLELTPNFDRLARQGTFLKNHFTCQPVCGPARACLQTGQYATTVGCHRNAIPLPTQARTLAKCFNDAGYDTGYIGKWHLGPQSDKAGVKGSRSFVHKKYRGGYQYWLAANTLEFTSRPYDCRLFDSDNQEVHLPGYRVDAMTDAAIRYLDQERENPFFLFMSFIEPHHQNHVDDYPPPLGYRERYSGRWVPPDLAALGGSTHRHLGGYYGMVKRLDEALGRLYDALVSLDLDRETILLFTSDHGCHFRTRNREYKRSCHESSIRLPGFLTGPGFRGGGQREELVSLVDLPPTLLEAAGLPVPKQMQGRSLLPRLRNPDAEWPEECFVQFSEEATGRALRTDRWKYAVSTGSPEAARTGHAKSYAESHLYDLWHDPHELENLVSYSTHAEVRKELRAKLLNWMKQIGEPPAKIRSAPRKEIAKRGVAGVSPER